MRLLLSLALCLFAASNARSAEGRAETADGSAPLRVMLWAAIGAEGDLYRQFRDQLVARGEAIRQVLERTATDGVHWQERLMAGIVLERLTKPREIEKVAQFWRDIEIPRGVAMRWEVLGPALAAQSFEIPLFLVEKVWKDNELQNPRLADYADAAWAADALGHLGEKRAVEPLIRLLIEPYVSDSEAVRAEGAASALARLKDPRAVPALCSTFVLYRGRARLGIPCEEGILGCVDGRTPAILASFARRLWSGSQTQVDLDRFATIIRSRLQESRKPDQR